jgi:hypothetical protein
MMVSFWLAAAAPLAAEQSRVYTNDDLDRVAPYRDQTGVASKPAVAPGEIVRERGTPQDAAREERYWRQQADRTAEQVRRLREQATALAERVEEMRRKPGVHPYSDPRIVSLHPRRQARAARARDAELRLLERARRAGALPGWLR